MRIAIIGAGASGTITAINLLKKLQQPASIFLIEKRNEGLYRGAAYSSQLDYEPLNVYAGRMSLYNDNDDDFYNWILENKKSCEEITHESFVSRRWYGEYLETSIKDAVVKKQNGVLCETVSTATENIAKTPEGNYLLKQEDGREITADVVILATGNEKPADVISKEAIQVLGESYVSNPWNKNPLENISAEESVLLIGTGLTMVDHVVSLKKKNHTAKVFALSRNGLLPRPHKHSPAYKIEREISNESIEQLDANILEEVEKAKSQNLDWRSVIEALRPVTTKIWQALSDESKSAFLNKYRIYWDIHRHRMPPASHNEISELISENKFEILKGTITDVLKTENGFLVSYKDASDSNSVIVNRIINCTGPSGDYEKCDNPLFKNLLSKGWIKKDKHNIGIVTGAAGELIQQNGNVLENIFAVGPLRKAMEWESTAIREIRTQAEQVAIQIISQANAHA